MSAKEREWWYGGEKVDAPQRTKGPADMCGLDEHGRAMFTNTHFKAEGEAWQSIIDNARAWQSMAVRDYRDAQSRLLACQKELADAAAKREEIEAAFAKWERVP